MSRYFNFLLLVIMLPQFAICDTRTSTVCADMLAEFMGCFSMERPPERLINEWKWGDIKSAYIFSFWPVERSEDNSTGSIFAACPATSNSNQASFSTEFPNISDLNGHDRPYLLFGVNRNRVSGKHSLIFVYCDKTSVIYPDVLNYFKLGEPSYEEVRSSQPSQCWDTMVYEEACFKGSRIDDQFIRWGELNSRLEWVFRFNGQNCVGVMLRVREHVQPFNNDAFVMSTTGTLDFREFTEKFIWLPDYQIDRFDRETQERLAKRRTKNGTDDDREYYDRRRLDVFSRIRDNYKDNGLSIQRHGLQFFGTVKTPSCDIFDVPWKSFSYYMATNCGMVLRSVVEGRGYFDLERIDSFVLNVDRMPANTNLLLPNGLDIKRYLHDFPSTNVLYEHVRSDKQARIIVQPYIAYLYLGKELAKVLICSDMNGPADHGWSLQRGYYCYEGMNEYYWPVAQAYCPLRW